MQQLYGRLRDEEQLFLSCDVFRDHGGADLELSRPLLLLNAGRGEW